MQPEKIEQIKGLIKVSRILNENERAEWLSLLELMNDKQLGELEKILNSEQRIGNSEQKKSAESIEHIVDSKKQEESKPISQKPAGQSASFQPVRPHMPSLSHIMNLPKAMGGHVASPEKQAPKNPSALPVKEAVPGVAVSSKTIKNKQNFADKLKAIFAEKELSSGKPKDELSLPQHTTEQKVAPVDPLKTKPVSFPEIQIKPSVADASKEKPTVVTASQIVIQGPVTFTKRDEASGGGMIISPELKNKIAIPGKNPPVIPSPKISAQSLQEKKLPVVDLSTFLSKQTAGLPKSVVGAKPAIMIKPEGSHKPGLNIQEVSEKIRMDTLATIKNKVSQVSAVNEVAHQKPLNEKPVELHWPKDLASLSISSFSEASLENYAKAIRHLIEKFGYYDVIFSLEKSSLYEVYIKTGVELMNKQQTFETFDSGQTMDAFLNREEFEKFTDLLRQIQAA